MLFTICVLMCDILRRNPMLPDPDKQQLIRCSAPDVIEPTELDLLLSHRNNQYSKELSLGNFKLYFKVFFRQQTVGSWKLTAVYSKVLYVQSHRPNSSTVTVTWQDISAVQWCHSQVPYQLYHVWKKPISCKSYCNGWREGNTVYLCQNWSVL